MKDENHVSKSSTFVYGVKLEDQLVLENATIPSVIIDCIAEIEKRGINIEGIYKNSGSTSKVKELKAMYKNGKYYFFIYYLFIYYS